MKDWRATAFHMLQFIMAIDISPEKIAGLTEIVICDSLGAMQAHKERFRFSQNAYINACEDAAAQPASGGCFCNVFPIVAKIIDTCNALDYCPSRIHLAMGWENILRVAVWKQDFESIWDVFIVLKKAGLAEACLTPFANSPVSDLFPFLYYKKEFDVLKRVCIITKKQIEARLKAKDVRVGCHLMPEDAAEIVASNL